MKRTLLIAMMAATALAGCEKNSFGVTERNAPPADAALVKVAVVSPLTTFPSVTLYLNGEKLSYPLAFNTPFPGGGLGTGGSNNSDFLIVKPGATQVEFKVHNVGTPIPAYTFYSTSVNFESQKRQVLFVSDTAANIAHWLVDAEAPRPDSGYSKIKFVNAIPNASAVDLYRGPNSNTATLVAGNIPYKGTSEFLDVTFGGDSLFLRPAGAAATTLPTVRGRVAVANQRTYVLYSRGYIGGTGTNRAPSISAVIIQ